MKKVKLCNLEVGAAYQLSAEERKQLIGGYMEGYYPYCCDGSKNLEPMHPCYLECQRPVENS